MLENQKIMLPLWLAYPELERQSIGWRMGYGESYTIEWHNWYQSLSTEDSAHYQELFPEPPTWKGFWKDTDECIYYRYKKFCIPLWQKGGIPKYSLDQVRKDYRSGKNLKYCMFWKAQSTSDDSVNKGCLSQWHKSHFFSVTNHYCCMEQFMMFQKAKLFDDQEMMQQILSCNKPNKIKGLGQKVRNFDEIVWSKAKYAIVLNGNYQKFSQNPHLKKFLLQTNDKILVEASPYDAIWGIKMDESDANAHNPLKWRGQNLLGFALMEVRDALRKVCENENFQGEAQDRGLQ